MVPILDSSLCPWLCRVKLQCPPYGGWEVLPFLFTLGSAVCVGQWMIADVAQEDTGDGLAGTSLLSYAAPMACTWADPGLPTSPRRKMRDTWHTAIPN